MKNPNALHILVVLGHAAEFHQTDEGVREAAERMLPEVKNAKLRVLVEDYIKSPHPLAAIREAIART